MFRVLTARETKEESWRVRPNKIYVGVSGLWGGLLSFMTTETGRDLSGTLKDTYIATNYQIVSQARE